MIFSRVANMAGSSTSSLAHEDNPNRSQDDGAIERHRHFLKVEQIVFHFVPGILYRGAVVVLDLGPAGQSGAHTVTFVIVGDVFAKLLDEHRPLRTRSDKTHLAADNVDELRQFIQPI